jgi:LPXTG-motif cell wall-anchored protein
MRPVHEAEPKGARMSQTKVVGTVTAASLPVTGSPVMTLVIAGAAMLITGLLLVRAGRFRRADNH